MEQALHRNHLTLGILILCALLISLLAIADAKDYSNSPTKGNLSSTFGWRKDPYTKKYRFHAGIDIAASKGAPIHVPQDGTVVFSGPYKGYGNVVVVQHNHNLFTLYGHTSQIFVHYGQPVQRGQLIALVGSSGRSTGPHLHFEVRQKDGFVNPLDYLVFLEKTQQPTIAQTMMPLVNSQNQGWSNNTLNAVGGPEDSVASSPKRQGKTVEVIKGNQVTVVKF